MKRLRRVLSLAFAVGAVSCAVRDCQTVTCEPGENAHDCQCRMMRAECLSASYESHVVRDCGRYVALCTTSPAFGIGVLR